MYTSVHDTIVALSSAPGHAPRGVVRLSGPEAIPIAAQLFRAAGGGGLGQSGGFAVHPGELVLDDLRWLPADVYLFRQPRSYTRQDLVELHTIGSPPVLDMIIERCICAGARLAEPGEFTARAFLAGAMNLAEAEAVASTIRARSDEQLRAARRMMRGELADGVRRWQEELADLLALVGADIDFAEEPIEFISPRVLTEQLSRLRRDLNAIIVAGGKSERLDVLPHMLLLGPSNAGKSTLLNMLSGMDRAIASAVSGTTRDILAAPVKLGVLEAVVLDAAGVGDDPDAVIAHGRQRAVEAAASVDLVCLVFDALRPVDRGAVAHLASLADAPTVVIVNKADTVSADVVRRRRDEFASCQAGPVCVVSAARGDGIARLRTVLESCLLERYGPSDAARLVLSVRQRAAFAAAVSALDRCAALADGADAVLDVAEVIALELREALDALGAITGTVSTEDLLHRVFASFCIGK